jgi:CubicO group peptidase (beta-lactamase class C family)
MQKRLDTYFEQTINDTYIPGIVAIVVDEKQILYEGAFGHQNVNQNIAMKSDVIHRIYSMTKPITSVAVLQLIQRGEMQLDDRIFAYLPDYKDKQVVDDFDPVSGNYTTRAAASEITVRQLLTHTAGIGYAFTNPVLAKISGAINAPLDFPLIHDPGTRWAYSQGPTVLGYLVEAVSGQPLDEYLQENILSPLQMTDTFYAVPSAKIGRVVSSHKKSGQALVESPNPKIMQSKISGGGGLFSTGLDYVKFIQMLLNKGEGPGGARILSPDSVKLMGQNQIGDLKIELQPTAFPDVSEPFPLGAGVDTFGLGFQITGEHKDLGKRSPGSLSWAGIQNTQFWIDPKKRIGAILFMQYLPFYDSVAIEVLQGFERIVYESLRSGQFRH